MLGDSLLGKSPLASMSFANIAINQILEASRNPATTDQQIFVIHLFPST
jgi:hypothetical protein